MESKTESLVKFDIDLDCVESRLRGIFPNEQWVVEIRNVSSTVCGEF